MAESVELPDWPAILPSRKKVLLPGAIIRIRCTSFSRVKLVEQELWQREEKGLIGIVPFRDDVAESSTPGSLPSPGIGTKLREPSSKTVDNVSESHKHGAVNNQEVGHWHNRGIAARALHLSRQVKKPSGRVTYSVVLEGLWRFSVQELSTRGMYCTARITSLDMTKHEMDQVEQELDFIALSRQFKGTAMELISVLEQEGGLKFSWTQFLCTYWPIVWSLACSKISFEEQLSMLDSVDVKARLSKATELVDRRLQSNRVTEEIRQKAESQLSMSQKEFLLKAQPPSYPDRQTADTVATPGVSVGLVSSAYGIEGEVEFIEATAMAGKGDLHATGQLDDATKESAQIAMTWVRARAMELNLVTAAESNLLEGRDIHIKFPPGAVLDLNR